MPRQIIDEIDVTIIVPIFNNASQNLRRCLDSIVGQTLKSIEIILVCDDNKQDSVAICKNYAANDQRISVLCLQGSNIGEACNQCISKSLGKYLTFVEPDDWMEPEMCQSMLEWAVKYDTDVTIAYHYDVKPDNHKKELNHELIWDSSFLNRNLTDKFAVPNFYLRWPYCWGNIYKKEFIRLNNIQFSQANTQDLTSYDLSFSFLVFCYMKSFCILRGSLYNHSLLPKSVANESPLLHAVNVLNKHSDIFDLIKQKHIDSDYLQLEAARCSQDAIHCYKKLNTLKQRTEFLSMISGFMRSYLGIFQINQFITQSEKDLIIRFVNQPGLTAFLDKRNAHIKIFRFLFNLQLKEHVSFIKIFTFPVLFIKNNPDYSTFNICMIPIRRRRVTKNLDNGLLVHRFYYFGLRIFKKTFALDVIKTYFLGFMVRKDINLEQVLHSISERLDRIPKERDILYYACLSSDIANTHCKTFPKFKNSNIGKSIAIFGSGPTLNYAPKINKSKKIACNRSYEFFLDTKCDYFFGQDYHGIKSFYNKAIKNSTYAFIGINVNKSITNAPPAQYRNLENVYSYYFHTWFYSSIIIKPNIESFPLADFFTVVHPALHFAFYTNPEVIYLVGCDTSTGGYANKNILQFKIDIDQIITGYRKFKEFRDNEYPETRIVSVNPIGLKGIFEDVYTEEFLDHNPDLDKDDIVIINEI